MDMGKNKTRHLFSRVGQVLLWAWQGVQVWSTIIALGIPAVLRAAFHNVFSAWSWYDQVLLFVGFFLVILGILAFISMLVFRERFDAKRQLKRKAHSSRLTPKEIADRSAFARALKAVVERLRLNASGSHKDSACNIFHELRNQLKAEVDKHILASQTQRLLDKEFFGFESEALNLEARVNKLASDIPSDVDISSFCTDITRLVQGYRQLVKELMTFLDGLQQEGIKAIWDSDPWSAKIYTELANDYDRLMVLIKDLRRDTPERFRSRLPSESDSLLENFNKASAIKPN